MEAVDFAAVQRIILWGQTQRIMLHEGKTGCSIQKRGQTSKTYHVFHDLTHKITHKKQHECMFIRLFDGIIVCYLLSAVKEF